MVTKDGKRTWQLTHDDAREGAPRWMPGAARVSYVADGQVWTAAPGGAPVQVTRAERGVREYAWSRSGALLYISPEPKTPEQEAREKEWGVVISPEEQWPERAGLWLLEEGKPRRIAVGEPSAPEFAPDGRFAYLDGKRLMVEGAAVADGVHFFAWAPDGKSIAYIVGKPRPEPYLNQFHRPVFQGSGSVWLWDGRARRLTEDLPGLDRLVWSRDGRRMAAMGEGTAHRLHLRRDARRRSRFRFLSRRRFYDVVARQPRGVVPERRAHGLQHVRGERRHRRIAPCDYGAGLHGRSLLHGGLHRRGLRARERQHQAGHSRDRAARVARRAHHRYQCRDAPLRARAG